MTEHQTILPQKPVIINRQSFLIYEQEEKSLVHEERDVETRAVEGKRTTCAVKTFHNLFIFDNE